MTAPRDDAAWRAFEARLSAVEPLIPDAPRWAGPAESPTDGTLNVVSGATIRRAGSRRSRESIGRLRLATGVIAVAVVAVGLAWSAGSRESGPGTTAGLPGWTHWRWVPVDGTTLKLDIASDRFVLADDRTASPFVVDLTTSPLAADRLVVYQAAAAMGCAAGSSAEYEWHLDGYRLTLVQAVEPCATRGATLGRTWVREFPRSNLSAIQAQPGEYRLGWLRPAVGLTLADKPSFVRVLSGPRLPQVIDDYWDMTTGSSTVVITRLDRLPVDVCREAAGDKELDAANLDDALAALTSVTGLEIGEARPTTVDGFDAFEVDVGITPDCADGQGRLWSAIPSTLDEDGIDGRLLPGGATRVRVVQVDDAFVAIAVGPSLDVLPQPPLDGVADELRPLIDSITFD